MALTVALLGSLLSLAPPPGWKPAAAPPPSAWARAGARPWAVCEELGRQAIALGNGGAPRGESGLEDNSVWLERVRRCPTVPGLLVLAARLELVAAGDVGFVHEPGTSLDAVVNDHRERVERAAQWARPRCRRARDAASRRHARPGSCSPTRCCPWVAPPTPAPRSIAPSRRQRSSAGAAIAWAP
ncbi:MAG: hypothetical protein U0168_30910 [Nannocystaceae bacterium]